MSASGEHCALSTTTITCQSVHKNDEDAILFLTSPSTHHDRSPSRTSQRELEENSSVFLSCLLQTPISSPTDACVAGYFRHRLLVLAYPARRPQRAQISVAQTCQQGSACACQPFTHAIALTTAPADRFTPWQLIVSTLTGVYAVRNLDKILGLAGRPSLLRSQRCTFTPPYQPQSRLPTSCVPLPNTPSTSHAAHSRGYTVLSVILPLDVDQHGARCGFRHSDAHQTPVAERHLLCAFLDILYHLCQRGR